MLIKLSVQCFRSAQFRFCKVFQRLSTYSISIYLFSFVCITNVGKISIIIYNGITGNICHSHFIEIGSVT